jgi:EAL domain-containing protein (putative c-di-GMP-specific phosphodiesterase class I)
MRTALKAALVNGELFALFQPQLTVDGARVVSAEALLRWRRPGVGTIGPDDFVPYAESHELIEALGSFMLDRACRTAATWTDLPVSINVSPLQFARADLAEDILSFAAAANLPPTRLEIEITETAPFGDIVAARRIIEALRAQGVVVALDDLGSGHATTCLMQQLPLDRVKLGKSVVDLAATQEGGEGVAKLIRHARDLGLGVTAEGVETEEQLAFLRACGCDRIQGYLFARPMMGDEIEDFVRLIAK